MAQSHECIFRFITRRFGSFPRKTFSNHILSDMNVLITHEELSEPVSELTQNVHVTNPPCAHMSRCMLANTRSCDRGITNCTCLEIDIQFYFCSPRYTFMLINKRYINFYKK